MRNICMRVRRVVEGVVGRVKKRQAQEVRKTASYCEGFLSGGINEIFLREGGGTRWKSDEGQEMSQLWQIGRIMEL